MDITPGTTRGTTHIITDGECHTTVMDMLDGMILGTRHGDGEDGTRHFIAEVLHTGTTQVAITTVDGMVVDMVMDTVMDTMQD